MIHRDIQYPETFIDDSMWGMDEIYEERELYAPYDSKPRTMLSITTPTSNPFIYNGHCVRAEVEPPYTVMEELTA